jgi:single-strand DNA-binding protein
MNETPITIVGYLVSDPVERNTQSGRAVTNFRVASTPRRFNRESNSYEDSGTLWMQIVCWQDAARNVAQSMRQGDPVILTGRLTSREYVKDEQRRVYTEVVADAVGHNLARGTSKFVKIRHAVGASSVAIADDGMPEDFTDEFAEQEFLNAELHDAPFDRIDAVGPDGPLVPVG